jgi:DNA-binding LacI/PurR family transcriptional regulator
MTSVEGCSFAKIMLSFPNPPDTIVCINDETAFGALHAASEKGLPVGYKIAIRGFDGVQSAQFTNPPLTTTDIPVYEIARKLVSLLVEPRIHKGSGFPHITIQPTLLVKESA